MVKVIVRVFIWVNPMGPLNKGVDANSIVLLSSQNSWSLANAVIPQ